MNKDFLEGVLVMVGFLLIVVGVKLAWDWNRYMEMDRELELWKRDLIVERNAEAEGTL